MTKLTELLALLGNRKPEIGEVIRLSGGDQYKYERSA